MHRGADEHVINAATIILPHTSKPPPPMFKGTKKAFERAPVIWGGHHTKDPEIEVWTKDFAAAKVAVNTIDRETGELQLMVNMFVKHTLELYNAFTEVANADPELPKSHKIPSSTNLFAPLQEIVGRVEAVSSSHAAKTRGFLADIRSLLVSVEELLKKSDHKKIDCDKVTQRQQIDYDDPKAADIPEVTEYLKYHYHMLSLIPQVLAKMQQLTELLVRKQLSYQLDLTGLIRDAIKKVSQANNIPETKDGIEVLQRWSVEIAPVVSQLAQTRTIGPSAVMPPHPQTWQRVKHVPESVATNLPSLQESKLFAAGVGESFKYGFSYIHPTDVKFFNPNRGMFGDITEPELKAAAEGRQFAASPVVSPAQPPTESDTHPNNLAVPGDTPAAPSNKVPRTSQPPSLPSRQHPATTVPESPAPMAKVTTATKAPADSNPFRSPQETATPTSQPEAVVTPSAEVAAAAPAPVPGPGPDPPAVYTSHSSSDAARVTSNGAPAAVPGGVPCLPTRTVGAEGMPLPAVTPTGTTTPTSPAVVPIPTATARVSNSGAPSLTAGATAAPAAPSTEYVDNELL